MKIRTCGVFLDDRVLGILETKRRRPPSGKYCRVDEYLTFRARLRVKNPPNSLQIRTQSASRISLRNVARRRP